MEGPLKAARGRSRGRIRGDQAKPLQLHQKPHLLHQLSSKPKPNAQPGLNASVAQAVPPATTRGRGRVKPPPPEVDGRLQRAVDNMTINCTVPGPSGDTDAAAVTRGTRRQNLTAPPQPVIVSGNGKIGSKGENEPLKSNYFEFTSLADFTLHQYRVDFLPDPDVTAIKKGLLSSHKSELGAYVFDGTVLYTMTRVDENKERVSIQNNNQQQVKIHLKLARDLLPTDPEYVQFLNIVFRRVLALMDWKEVNRDYWDPRNKIRIPEHNLEIWPGYSTSIRQLESGILLNVELGSKVIRKTTAYSALEELKLKNEDYKEVYREMMSGSVVITPYNNRTYKIDDVDWSSNPNTTFDMKGSQVSFKDYFCSKYNLNVRCPYQPLLVSNPSKRDIRSGRTTVVKLIPELCNLTGIDDAMRRNFTLMKAIAVNTRVAPEDRIQRVERGFLSTLMSKQDTAAELQRWNMELNPSIVSFNGRRLPAETIYIGGDDQFQTDASTGDFTQPLVRRRKPLKDTPRIQNWSVLFPNRLNGQEVDNFLQTLARACSSFQFLLPRPKQVSLVNDKSAAFVGAIEDAINDKAQLIMCVVPGDNPSRYADIKKKCYVHRSIPNQVVLGKNVAKANMSVCSKIGIQLACKVGGSPWTVNIPKWKTIMIAGFDVCHDTSQREKAFGALVASMNNNQTRYASFVQPHRRGEEISPFMGTLMEKAVLTFMRYNDNQVPTKIIFYRDGVGEGNFHYVQEQEVQQIINHLQTLYGDQVVPLVYIVVSKRINTRLFRAADDNNPYPGTVADSCVTNPLLYDFFLVSQSVRQGTVSPTYYVVLHDSIGIKPDVVQQLTYKMCHMYFNWSGTIRVPAPVQYAHKLAFMVGQHLHTVPTGAEQSMDTVLYYL